MGDQVVKKDNNKKTKNKQKYGKMGDSLFVLYENRFFLNIVAFPYFKQLVRHAKNVANDNHNGPNSCNMKQIGNKYV